MTQRAFEVFGTFLKLGCTSFGGPVAHVGYFYKDFVERKQWLTEQQFAQLLSICQLLPGPASSQLGFCVGLARAGWLGGLAAFVAFTVPSVLLLLVFSSFLPLLSGTAGQAALHGLKIVAFAIVADAVISMFQKLCPDRRRASIACFSAIALLLWGGLWTQLSVIVAGAIAGVLWCNNRSNDQSLMPAIELGYGRKMGVLLLVLFVSLLLVSPFLLSSSNPLAVLASDFYRIGALVFGGGHVVLPLLSDAVVSAGPLPQETFMAGYGASQAIPGPMFSFAAYLGALIAPGGNAGIGAATALVCIFLPGFLLVAGVLPFWQHLGHLTALNNAFAGINAAVVGLLGAALYDPVFTSAVVAPIDMAIGLATITMLRVWQLPVLIVVVSCVMAAALAAVWMR